ncbi:MAG: PmoA family protein [Mameliella sp.]|nr:PmoA family protein [Phaeodactylibacter sp.]NRA51563.1 PmoA family protein [Phaeodactylibacter sp.]
MRFALLLCAVFIGFFSNAQSFEFRKELGALTLYYDEEPCFTYQTSTLAYNDTYPRSNYLHPVHGLSGEVLTEDFPEDHLHHRGIFWTWHQLYADDVRVGDPWLCEGIQWIVEVNRTEARSKRATIWATVYWLAGADAPEGVPDTLVKEEIQITTYKKGRDVRLIDFDIKLMATAPGIRIGGSEDKKGYGGFSVRLNTTNPLTFTNQNGEVTPQTTAVEAGGWVRATGKFNALLNEQTSVVMMCAPQQLPQFQGWILRKKNSMQNSAFPGAIAIELNQNEPLQFQNRILLHKGELKDKKVEKLYRQFLRKR